MPRLFSRAPLGRAAALTVAVSLGVVSTAAAHDHWLIPDLFAFGANATLHINARQGTRFPSGRAIEPPRVVDARVIGAASTAKVTEMTVEGPSLRLHHKPAGDGQYLVALALAPRTFRQTPEGVLRFLRAEGGALEAARLERERTLAGMDSVVFAAASYASTIVEVGRSGPRAFTKQAGFPLEFVPANDPAHVHVGDTLHVKVFGAGKPVPGIGVDAMPALDTAATGATASGTPGASLGSASPSNAAPERVTLQADANGVVHLPLTKAGAWMLRGAYLSRKTGAASSEWDLSRTTYVVRVGAAH
jgi:hypothetical protein